MDFFLPARLQPHLLEHDNLLSLILNQYQALPPVWLFYGPRGIGKETLSYHLAKKILTSTGLQEETINRQIASRTFPNLLVIEEENKEISSEQVKSVLNSCCFSAFLPGWRVIIINALDNLNHFGANALLKTLEEPPPQTLFLLIAHNLSTVLPTIRSRSFKVSCQPLKKETLKKYFPFISDTLLDLSQGSLGQLLKLSQKEESIKVINQIIEQNYSGNITQEILDKLPDLELFEEVFLWILSKDLNLQTVKKIEVLKQYFNDVKKSHLDKNHFLTGALLLLENPDALFN